jgi:hypothetical protein
MTTEEDQKRIRIEDQRNQTRAKLFGISLEELSRIENLNQSPEIELRREKVRKLFEEHNPLLEPKIVEYLIQRATHSHAPIQKRDSCDVCGESYGGAHSICGDCAHILQDYL